MKSFEHYLFITNTLITLGNSESNLRFDLMYNNMELKFKELQNKLNSINSNNDENA